MRLLKNHLFNLVVLLCSLFFQVELHSQCATYNVSISPEAVDGFYYSGTPVEVCVEVTNWDGDAYDLTGQGAEYIHGVQPINIGSGWAALDMDSGDDAPETCSADFGGIGWRWTEHPSLGWGWFFESPLNFDPIDNDPSNNHGDSNNSPAGENCDWTFCFKMQVAHCTPSDAALSLDFEIDIYSDGESGAWTSNSCSADSIFSIQGFGLNCIPLSTNQLQLSTFEIYPNPVEDVLFFDTKSFSSVMIVDSKGRLVDERKDTSGLQSISLQALHPGIYFLIGQTADGILHRSRFVKR